MLRPQRRSNVFGIGAILLGFFAGLYLIVSKSFKKPGKAKDIKHHKQATSAADALTYWTADKMRHANAVELPHVDTLERDKPQPPRQA